MRSEIVGQPSHNERAAREDASSDQEGSTILDHVVVARDKHDVSTHSDRASDQHEGASHAVLVGKICDKKHAEEGSNVWWHSQKLCVNCLVSQALNDRRQEQRVRIDRCDDREEVQR